jgi:hypothetical protein
MRLRTYSARACGGMSDAGLAQSEERFHVVGAGFGDDFAGVVVAERRYTITRS